MRYMLLVYTQEKESGLTREQAAQLTAAHYAVMQETAQKGGPAGCRTAGPHHNRDHRTGARWRSVGHGRTVR